VSSSPPNPRANPAYVVVIHRSAVISLELGCNTPMGALLRWLSLIPVVVQQGPIFVAATTAGTDSPRQA
jgi:hypothetical protein